MTDLGIAIAKPKSKLSPTFKVTTGPEFTTDDGEIEFEFHALTSAKGKLELQRFMKVQQAVVKAQENLSVDSSDDVLDKAIADEEAAAMRLFKSLLCGWNLKADFNADTLEALVSNPEYAPLIARGFGLLIDGVKDASAMGKPKTASPNGRANSAG